MPHVRALVDSLSHLTFYKGGECTSSFLSPYLKLPCLSLFGHFLFYSAAHKFSEPILPPKKRSNEYFNPEALGKSYDAISAEGEARQNP